MYTTKKSKLNAKEERLINAMQALGDQTRYKIFKIMLEGQEKCVSEIADAVNISVPAVSQHFRIFELVGMITKQRYGQKICYSLKKEDKLVKELIELI
jgi:DNA-binding transcriptional ArsR family regulator